MKIVLDFLKVFGSAQLLIQAVMYVALILIQVAYPKASWLQMIVAAVFLLAIQGIFVFVEAKGDKVIVKEDTDEL